MKNEILAHINNAPQLEKMYRSDKQHFRQEFNQLYAELKGNALADFWHERLNYAKEDARKSTPSEIIFIVVSAILAGIVAKIPAIFDINEDFFYPRNIGFIVFPFLTAFFAWKNRISLSTLGLLAAASVASLIFINLLPELEKSDTTILSCIHLVLFLWCLLGISFVGQLRHTPEKRLRFLKYNGDLLVITALMLIAGAILTGITLGLFQLIGMNIEDFYTEYIVVFGLAAVPLLGTYLTQVNPQLVGRVSPVIAKLFSPLVLIMLVIYLAAILISGKDPYNDREFLLIFNALLVGVMALIFFSVAETSQNNKSQYERWLLFSLSVVTLLVNGIALSAILFRIAEWGITPNRAAVLGGNVVMLIHLLLVATQLYKNLSKKGSLIAVGHVIANYLPVYLLWTTIVLFVFPLIFGFR